MNETTMSEYIKGFDAGVDYVLTEIALLEKQGFCSLDRVLKHLDPRRDEKAAQMAEKEAS
jgi:hypothetical protein